MSQSQILSEYSIINITTKKCTKLDGLSLVKYLLLSLMSYKKIHRTTINIWHKILCLLLLIFMGLVNALKMGPFLHKNYQINKKKSDMTTVFSYIHSFTLFLESILYSLYSTNVYMKILKLIYAHLKTTGYPFY